MKSKLVTMLLVFFISVTAGLAESAKKIEVKGKVTDADNKAVRGAMIIVDDVNTGITTNRKGEYKIKVSPEAMVIKVMTHSGEAQASLLDGASEINFSLQFTTGKVEEIIIPEVEDDRINVGYGKIKKENLTTNIQKIEGDAKNHGYTNIYDMLRGKPGVQVNGKSVTIQGPGSMLLSTEPLYIVDGVPVRTIEYIAPMTVQSIEILKGSAASIYGSRGANGVIVINLIM